MAGERLSQADLFRLLSQKGLSADDLDGDFDATDDDAGAGIIVQLAAGSAVVGEVKVTDGTDDLAINTNGSIIVADASGNVQPAGDTVGRASFVKLTDGTDTALVTATGEQAVRLTDGTNLTPIGDAAARAIVTRITDGTDTWAIDSSGAGIVAPFDGSNFASFTSTGAQKHIDINKLLQVTMQTAASGTGDGTSLIGSATSTINGAIFAISNSANLTSGTLVFEGSVDGTNWFTVTAHSAADTTAALVASVDFSAAAWDTATTIAYKTTVPASHYRARISVAVVGGTITVVGRAAL